MPISLRIFQFIVIHTVKGVSVVNEAEVGVFLGFLCFFYDPTDANNLIYFFAINYFTSFHEIKWLNSDP